MEDKQSDAPFPLEGNVFAKIILNMNQSLSDEYFRLGLETNYEQMQRFVLERKRQIPEYLFTDPKFSPESRILVKSVPISNVYWRRPHQMSPNPKMFHDGPSRHDVVQGELGDCYWLSPCAAVAMQPKLMEKIIPQGQSLQPDDQNYNGLLRFRLWRFGKWREVVIDDWLPTRNGHAPIYGRSSHPDEFWPALLEKAYAKLHGSYDAMVGGFNSNALVDLTGGIAFEYDVDKLSELKKDQLFDQIKTALRHNSLVCCGIEKTFNPVTREGIDDVTGLVVAHAYTITDATKIRLKHSVSEKLVRVRNPWGDSIEWKHGWSDRSHLWKTIGKKATSRLRRKISDDGEWWMTYSALCRHFQHLTICTLGPDFDQDGKLFEGSWLLSTIRGSWSGSNAGGSGNDVMKYATNPQYLMRLFQPDELSTSTGRFDSFQCSVQIGLMQEYRRLDYLKELQTFGIGLRIYKVKNRISRKLQPRFLRSSRNLALQTKIYKQEREISLSETMDPGYYVIIPSTFYPGSTTSFLIRIFTEKTIELTELR